MVVVDSVMKHEVKRTYRYRLYPNEAQKQELARTFGCSRWVYNWALETKTKAYYQDEESLSFTDLSSRLTSKKKEEETEWLSEVSAVTLQQSLRNLNQAFTNFFEGRAEYPSFKSKKGDQTARHVGTAFDIREENGKRKLRLSKMPGLIRVRWSRELPSEPSSCTVTKNAAGQYHVCFVCTEEARLLPRVNGEGGDLEFVGVDLGIESLVTLSTGEKVGNPRWFENEYERLRREQQKLSRKEQGSNNWERQPRPRGASGSVAWGQKVPTTSARAFGPMKGVHRDIDWSAQPGTERSSYHFSFGPRMARAVRLTPCWIRGSMDISRCRFP